MGLRELHALCASVSGAVEAGLLEPTPLQEPPSELKAALASWTKFWQDLKVTAQQQGGVALTERQLDRVQQALWFCHTESIQMALKIYEPQLLLLSREEQLFGSGWARFVEVLAAVAWRTDLEAVASLGAGDLVWASGTGEWCTNVSDVDRALNTVGTSQLSHQVQVVCWSLRGLLKRDARPAAHHHGNGFRRADLSEP